MQLPFRVHLFFFLSAPGHLWIRCMAFLCCIRIQTNTNINRE